MDNIENTLIVGQPFHKFYVCDSCGTFCYFCVTNDFNSLPQPNRCPYKSQILNMKANWRPLSNCSGNGKFFKIETLPINEN